MSFAVNAAGYGNSIWTPTGLSVQQGDTLVFQTDNGNWCSGGVYNGGPSCGGADGIRPAASYEHPLELDGQPSPSIGLLIGSIHYPNPIATSIDFRDDFAVGGNPITDPLQCCPTGEIYVVIAPDSGSLDLAMNDVRGAYGDNSGAIGISILDAGPSASNCPPGPLPNLHMCSFTPVPIPPPAP